MVDIVFAPARNANRKGRPPTALRVASINGVCASGDGMALDLAWRDALAVAGRQFTRAECDAGWPETMQPFQLALLQRPWVLGDALGRRTCDAMYRELVAACDAGRLPHTTTTERKCVEKARHVHPSQTRRGWDGGFGNSGGWPSAYTTDDGVQLAYTKPAVFRDVTHLHITAPAFAAWLAGQGLEPSQHVAAWFKVRGVAAQAAAAPEPEAINTYADLVRFRASNEGAPWTDAMRALLALEEQRRKAVPGAKGVREGMGKDLGISSKRLGELLRQHKEATRSKPATDRTGTR